MRSAHVSNLNLSKRQFWKERPKPKRIRSKAADDTDSAKAVVITDLVSVHLLFSGGKEPKSRWAIMHFEFTAKKPGGK